MTSFSQRCVIFTAILVLTFRGAKAEVSITANQIDTTVVFAGSGTLDTAALTSNGPVDVSPVINPPFPAIIEGLFPPTSIPLGYSGISGPSSFGPGASSVGPPESGSGDEFGISSSSQLVVPNGYQSGSKLSATDTYAGTLSSLGLTPGTYTWTWGTGADADSLTLQINSPAAVPEPSTAIVALVGAVAFVTYGWTCHRRHQRRQDSA